MARFMVYWFRFEDGYRVCCRGMSQVELKAEVRKHGKLIEVTPA